MRYLGLLTDENRWLARRMHEVFRLKPVAFLKAVAKQANISFVSALFKFILIPIRMPRKEKEAVRRWSKMWNEIDNPEELIECVPDSLPYRNAQTIK